LNRHVPSYSVIGPTLDIICDIEHTNPAASP
jgi:hypothetical protein